MSTSPPPNRRLEVSAQDLAQARNLHYHSKYTECAALLLTAERGAEDATALLKAALDGVRKHPRQALGLDDEASASDAKKAYRKLALKLHPDKCEHPVANDAMQALNVAYDKITVPPKPKQQAAYGGKARPGPKPRR